MDQSDPVSREEYEASVTALVAVLAQVLGVVRGLALVLHKRGLVTPELWDSVVSEAESSAQDERVREAIQKLRPNGAIERILKDFQGPIQ